MRYTFSEMPTQEVYHVMTSVVVPRPIALVTSHNQDGLVNLAPFSYFNAVSSRPPIISLSISQRRWEGELVFKDTLRNIESRQEFVVHIPTESMLDVVNDAATEYPPDVSEVEALGLQTQASEVVRVPRLVHAPLQLECKLSTIVWVGEKSKTGLVLGEVVCVHIDDAILDESNKYVDPTKLRPLARLGGSLYGTLGPVLSRKRR